MYCMNFCYYIYLKLGLFTFLLNAVELQSHCKCSLKTIVTLVDYDCKSAKLFHYQVINKITLQHRTFSSDV